MNKLSDLLDRDGAVVIDGAMGTQLFATGLQSGDPPEPWNIDHPDRIRKVHDDYIAAGSQIILTNSFGGTTSRLKLHNLQDQSYELNKAAAAVGRASADSVDQTVIVAGSMGPTGELFEPMGPLTHDETKEIFAIQASGLADGGADVFWIETMSDIAEVTAAVAGIRSVSELPICATMSFDTKGRTMMGVTPRQAVRQLVDIGVWGIGGNCGNGVDEIEGVIDQMRDAAPDAVLIAKSNAGIPKWLDGELYYDGSPKVMAEYAQRVRALGASIIGACCGSGPEHITAMAEALHPEAEPAVVPRGHDIEDVPAAETPAEGEPRRRRRRSRD